MKRYIFITLISTIFFSLLTLSCEKNNIDNNSNSKTSQVEIKGYPGSYNNATYNKMYFTATADKLIIDWGDGSVDDITPNGVLQEFVHQYQNQNFQTITISSENLSYFYGYPEHMYREFRFKNCLQLKEINCYGHSLTVLELDNVPALLLLNASANYNLNTSAVTTIFNGLPIRKVSDNAKIYIDTSGADESIATKKGWSVNPN